MPQMYRNYSDHHPMQHNQFAEVNKGHSISAFYWLILSFI